MNWPDDYIVAKPFHADEHGIIYHGDAIRLMKRFPEQAFDVIYTDPVWPDCKVDFGVVDPTRLFARAGKQFARLTGRLIVHLGVDTDPRFLNGVSKGMKFLRCCYLRRVPMTYKGPIMVNADVAYVFGHGKLPGDGSRVLAGEITVPSKYFRSPGNNHPCPRNLGHVSWLMRKYSRPGWIVLDPFAGSGTAALAAMNRGCRYVIIDKELEYCEMARDIIDNYHDGRINFEFPKDSENMSTISLDLLEPGCNVSRVKGVSG